MRAQTLKRTFLRTHRYAMNRQRDEKQRGASRSYRTPEGRALIASNHAWLTLHPEWRR